MPPSACTPQVILDLSGTLNVPWASDELLVCPLWPSIKPGAASGAGEAWEQLQSSSTQAALEGCSA